MSVMIYKGKNKSQFKGLAHEQTCVGGLKTHVKSIGRQVENLSGDIALAFLRGYQGGYEDKVMERSPRHYARTTKKMIKGKE